MDIGAIIEGHIKEITKSGENLRNERMKICEHCPLFISSGVMGSRCSPYLYVNPETNDVSFKYKKGYKNGCGCRLEAKTRLKRSKCPLGKWK